ncbi:histone-fold-containing protein [Xylariaceae sp. FL0804]|nr:histone-fold-containing protein [Xylariaceae sp. FL0804]
MPSKKADPARKSNTSTAHFVFDGDVAEPAAPPAAAQAMAAMPPLKPSTSTEMETDRLADSSAPGDKDGEKKDSHREKDSVTIEDLNLPKSIITRLAKGVLPPNTQIQANAILAMSKSATVFINYLANAANTHTQNSNKKTIMPNDVFDALDDIEFPFFRQQLEAEFKKFNETQTTKRNTYRRRVAAQKKAEKAGAGGDPNASMLSTTSAATDTGSGAAPRSKKQKPNAPDDSQMDVDGADETQEHDASDPETESEHHDEDDDDDDDDDDEGQDNAEDEDEDEEDEQNEDEMHDALEERELRDDGDDALDDGGESD